MRSIKHVCQAGSAMEKVESIVGEHVVGIPDDCAIGPLIDVDSTSPVARVAFWTEVYSTDHDMSRFDWSAALLQIRDQLASLVHDASEVVIWAGAHPTEQALRRRVHWWLGSARITVSEVLPGAEDLADATCCIDAPVALASPVRLRSLFEQRFPVAPKRRDQLADEWATLRDDGHGVRAWEGDRPLGHPVDYCDGALLSLVGGQPASLGRVIGEAMAETGRCDSFCRWRIATLVQSGRLSLASGTLRDWHSATVSRPEK